jgi:hypothetical protein
MDRAFSPPTLFLPSPGPSAQAVMDRAFSPQQQILHIDCQFALKNTPYRQPICSKKYSNIDSQFALKENQDGTVKFCEAPHPSGYGWVRLTQGKQG